MMNWYPRKGCLGRHNTIFWCWLGKVFTSARYH